VARETLFNHRKLLRLAAALGDDVAAVGHLEWMWHSCNATGDPVLGFADDVERAAHWRGEPGRLCAMLAAAGGPDEPGFIEPLRGEGAATVYVVHDYAHHAPKHAGARREREEARRQARICEWCGETFFSSDPRARFCPGKSSCRSAASRAAKRKPEGDDEGSGEGTGKAPATDHATDTKLQPKSVAMQPKSVASGTHASHDVQRTSVALRLHEPSNGGGQTAVQQMQPKCNTTPDTRHPTPDTYKGTTANAVGEFEGVLPGGPDTTPAAGVVEPFELAMQQGTFLPPPPDPVVLAFPCVPGRKSKGTEWVLHQSTVERMVEAYPGFDVPQMLRSALVHVRAAPGNRKTFDGMERFLFSWIERDVAKGNHRLDRNGHGSGNGRAPFRTPEAALGIRARGSGPELDRQLQGWADRLDDEGKP
jgi:hypothetical protein